MWDYKLFTFVSWGIVHVERHLLMDLHIPSGIYRCTCRLWVRGIHLWFMVHINITWVFRYIVSKTLDFRHVEGYWDQSNWARARGVSKCAQTFGHPVYPAKVTDAYTCASACICMSLRQSVFFRGRICTCSNTFYNEILCHGLKCDFLSLPST